MKGLKMQRKPGTEKQIHDEAFMRTLALLCVLGDVMQTAQNHPADIDQLGARFLNAALKTWPFEGIKLIRSTEFMAEDLGYVMELSDNVQVGTT